MSFSEIKELLIKMFGNEIILKEDTISPQKSITIDSTHFLEICQFLHVHLNLYFDFLSCITAIDNGP